MDGSPVFDPAVPDFILNNTDHFQVNCPARQEYCDTNVLVMYPQLEYPNYKIEIEFLLDPQLNSLVDGMVFNGRTQNPKFTAFLMAFRYTLFAVSVLALLVYGFFYCRQPSNHLTFEHKFILLLSASLCFFNDPIFGITIMKPTIAAAVFSTLFVMQFIGLLVVFWVAMWRRMHMETVSPTTAQANWAAWLLGFIVFVLLTVAGSASSVYTRLDPSSHVYAK